METLFPIDLGRIAQDLQIRKVQVESVVQLLDEGNTVPFVTRYRKERTGGLNEVQIREIQGRVQKIRDLRRMCDERGLDPWIEVDGGIKAENAWKVIEAGANAIVSGSGVFNQPDYAAAITGIRNSKRPGA